MNARSDLGAPSSTESPPSGVPLTASRPAPRANGATSADQVSWTDRRLDNGSLDKFLHSLLRALGPWPT